MNFLNNKLTHKDPAEYIDSLKSFDKRGSTEIPTEDILSRICVSRPYFAFNKIYRHNEFLISEIFPQQQKGKEASIITVGESGRHMAILGSCACGLEEVDKYYYLVERADIKNHCHAISMDYKSVFIAMRTSFTDRRRVGAEGLILDENMNIIYEMSTSYHKIAIPLFKKFFKKHFRDTITESLNPYLEYLDLKIDSIIGNKFNISLPHIKDINCAGHFSGCPSVPTAFLVYNIIQVCGDYISEKHDSAAFIVDDVNLNLFELIFPDLEKSINVTYDNKKSNIFNFKIKISQGDKLNSEVSFLVILKK